MAKAIDWLTCAATAGVLQTWPRKAQSITTLIKEDRMRGFGSVVVLAGLIGLAGAAHGQDLLPIQATKD